MKSILPDILRRIQTSPAESLVLQSIAYRANVQGMNARVSYAVLAAVTEFSERWVKELVRRLEERHLWRVQRSRIGPAKCGVNIYTVVRPWLRELGYAEAYARKQERTATAHLSQDLNAPPKPTGGENKFANRVPKPRPIALHP